MHVGSIVLDDMCQGKVYKSTMVIIWEKGGVVIKLYLQTAIMFLK